MTRADQIGHWVDGLSVAGDPCAASTHSHAAKPQNQLKGSDINVKSDPKFVQEYLKLPSDWNLPRPGIIISVTGSATADFDLQEEVWYHRNPSGECSGVFCAICLFATTLSPNCLDCLRAHEFRYSPTLHTRAYLHNTRQVRMPLLETGHAKVDALQGLLHFLLKRSHATKC